VTGVEIAGAALDLGQLEQPGLVQVRQAPPFGSVGVDFALEAGQFGGEDFVVGTGHRRGDGRLCSLEHVGTQKCGSDLFEHEGVERVGTDAAFGAALGAHPDAGVVGAPVVAVDLPAAGNHLLAADIDPAGTAAHEPAQKPCLHVLG
jgi:hypothetical protein